jgi:S1-C subfamily serine protease
VAQTPPVAPPAAPSHRLRSGAIFIVLLLLAAGGGIVAGRVSVSPTTSASGTSPTSNSVSPPSSIATPGGSSGTTPGGSSGSGTGNGSGNSGGAGTSPESPSGSTGSGASTGVGAGGASLNAASIAAKVDPGLVDVNVVLAYQEESGAGTGIVLTSTGEVLTNNHVVDGATSISVTDIGNGRTYAATVVGTDASGDIAVIQLKNASGLATADLGDSATLKTGEPVLAIGNAGGLGGTPSTAAGAVVALNQPITATDDSGANSEHLTGLVETDDPIEPGDSGGPLVNSSGQVLAIDTAGSSTSRFASTAPTQSYAIPIDTALTIAGQIENGQSSATIRIGAPGILGVEVEESGESAEPGAVIAAVIVGSPAASAGLEEGDVIVSLNGEAVDSPSVLSNLMSGRHPGDRVTVGFDDGSGQLHTVTVTLASGPPT